MRGVKERVGKKDKRTFFIDGNNVDFEDYVGSMLMSIQENLMELRGDVDEIGSMMDDLMEKEEESLDDKKVNKKEFEVKIDGE